MAMGRQGKERQGSMWVPTAVLASSPGHPFYVKLEQVLRSAGFDAYVEKLCARHYAGQQGRPSIPPGVYFRMLLIGYFERLDSERGIAWRCADSLSLRRFLGLGLEAETPHHSSLTRIRGRLPLAAHQEVFGWVLRVLAAQGLIDGKTLGVDATTLEANAALRSIVRRDSGETYESFLQELAKASGVATPTRTDLARLDRKRAKKGANDEWVHPGDPEAQISKMKDGRTHLAHKLEQAVDMSGEGAVLAVTLHGGAQGDTQSLAETLEEAQENLDEMRQDAEVGEQLHEQAGSEVVADKGYHSNDVLVDLDAAGYRTYISEPDRGRRHWQDKEAAQAATYANRRRIRGERGKRLLRRRGELLERPFAHYLEAGGLRRTHLRGHRNILKRLLVHVAGFNLGLLMRELIGTATPREYAARLRELLAAFSWLRRAAARLIAWLGALLGRIVSRITPDSGALPRANLPLAISGFSTGY
jgi:transposase